MTETLKLPRFEEFSGTTVSALDNPAEAVAASASLLRDDRESGRPVIEMPGDTHVRLDRGIYRAGTWYRDAEVRELTGEDEEAIAASRSNPYRMYETLLTRGTRRIGPEFMTPKLAAELLIGDRENLLLGIRRATFGDEIEFKNLPCPHCEEQVDLTVSLSDIPRISLPDPEQTEYEVPLRKGAVAFVCLPTGGDQQAVYNLRDSSEAKQSTEILTRCVLSVLHADGTKENKPKAKQLSMADRKTLLQFIADQQPGPRYLDFSFEHEACGKEVALPISLATLFRGL